MIDWRLGGSRGQALSEQLETVALTRAEKAVVADLDQPFGQDVLQEAADKLLSGEGASAKLPGVIGFVAKGDPIVINFDNPVVAKGHPEEIASQVVEGGQGIADRLSVDHPRLAPGLRWNLIKESRLFQSIPKLGPEDDR